MKKIFRIVMAVTLIIFVAQTASAISLGGKQLVQLPKNSSSREYKSLGYVEALDSIIDKTYAFLIQKETNLDTGYFKISIRSNKLTGTYFDEKVAAKLAKQALKDGKQYVTRGAPFNPAGKLDERRIEYRLYQKDGKPDAIEVYVVTRNKKRKANKPKILRASWPGK